MYWLEGVHSDTGGGNNFEATVRDYNDYSGYPADGDDTKLAGNMIGIYVPRIPWVNFLQQPTNLTQMSGGNSVTFSVKGTNPPSIWLGTTTNPYNWLTNPPTSSLQYQWYKNGTLIPGATGSSYTQPYVLPSDQNAQFVCAMRALGYADDSLSPIWSNSQPAVLTVVTDSVPPSLTYAATFVNTNQDPNQIIVDVTFDKWMDGATLSNAANYSIAGVTIMNVSVGSNHRTAELVLNQMPTLPLTVSVTGVKDLSGNTIAANSSTTIRPEPLTFSDIGTPGTQYTFGYPGIDPAYPSVIYVEGNGSYLVSAEGSDIWGAADGFNFGWELKTNDFDMVVRGVRNGHTSQYAKAGLMVREDLTPYSRNWNIINDPASSDGIMAPDNSGYGRNVVECNMRDTYGLDSANWDNLLPRDNSRPAYPNAWLRLKRTGNVLDAFYSTNGVSWSHAASYDTSTNVNGVLTNVVYVGICTTAHNNDSYDSVPPFLYYNTAEYANYTSSYAPVNAPVLAAGISSGNVVISWSPAGGHLEASPALSGPGVDWQPVGSSNPATVPLGPGNQYFRVVTP